MVGKDKKFAEGSRKRKANQIEHAVSQKVKQTKINPPNQSNNLYGNSSDESDENENANSIRTLRESLGLVNRDDSSGDESLSTEPKRGKGIHDVCIKSDSTSQECDEDELSRIDEMSRYQRKSALRTSKRNFNQKNARERNKRVVDATLEDNKDPFEKHLLSEIPSDLISSVQTSPKLVKTFIETLPELGKVAVNIPIWWNVSSDETSTKLEQETNYTRGGQIPKIYDLENTSLLDMYVKSQLSVNIHAQKKKVSLEGTLPPYQNELFSLINNYQDLYYTKQTLNNRADIRSVYCLHFVNHVLKAREKVLHHNDDIFCMDAEVERRDQGLVRPKVLVVVPFMESALKVVSMIEGLLLHISKGNVMNKKRFLEEYTGKDVVMPYRNRKPKDFETTFAGNINDDFKIGISITEKCLKLYANFYSTDIIIASPLGLRRIIGAEGEQERDYDFLASIEILILDQTEIFLMQNWNHVTHIFDHLHLQPKKSHGVDFSRVRLWSLTGKSKFYRQTLIFSSFDTPEISSLFNKRCSNYSGSIKTITYTRSGSIASVVVPLSHRFFMFSAASANDSIKKRFHFFIKKIMPCYKELLVKQVLIFIPSYYDFVKIRNYFRKEMISFAQICEYSKERKVARARDMFFHADVHFLLYTERFHFFNRIKLRGIQHLVFYQPPYNANFYSEMCNLLHENYLKRERKCTLSVSVIFSKYDLYQLSGLVGVKKAHTLIKSEQNSHIIVSGGE